jgi:putative colanic acid biosynthesis glycosyltransferase
MQQIRVAFINTYNRFSTGNCIKNIIGEAEKNGFSCKLFYGRSRDKKTETKNDVWIGASKFVNFVSNVLVKITGKVGGFHKSETRKLIKELDDFKPDIVNLHNIHGNYLNYKMLFQYLKSKNVIITMHDSFYLTGRCAHYQDGSIICDRWQKGCGDCPRKKAYPATLFFDKSQKLFQQKSNFYASCKSLTVIAIAKWSQDAASKSMLANHDIRLIPNGINIQNINFEKRQSDGKTYIFCAAQDWQPEKGLNDLAFLAENLDRKKFVIYVAGNLNHDFIKKHPVASLGTLTKDQMNDYYRKSDLFLSVSHMETFPTVLLEAMANGLPVVSYDVGGCKEIIGNCGMTVEPDNQNRLLDVIRSFDKERFSPLDSIERAKKFDIGTQITQYVQLLRSKNLEKKDA